MNNLIQLVFQEIKVVKSPDNFLELLLGLGGFFLCYFQDGLTSFGLVCNFWFFTIVLPQTIVQEVDILAYLVFKNCVQLVLDELAEFVRKSCLILLRNNFDRFEQKLKRFIQQ
jgi:hypothetical protein